MPFLGLILNAFGGALLKPILSWLQAKNDAARDIAVAQIGADKEQAVALLQAQIQANVQAAAMAAKFPWVVILTWLPFALHLWAVAIVTILKAPIEVPAFPAVFQQWEGIILLAPFVQHPVMTVANAVSARLKR